MNKVTELKVSLMEKDKGFSIDASTGKGNYIVRTTGTFRPEDYIASELDWMKTQLREEYDLFVENSAVAIYDNLIDNSAGKVFDAVGVWFTFDDGRTIDNAMDISVMDSMMKYGEDGVIPILEFVKMTLEKPNES